MQIVGSGAGRKRDKTMSVYPHTARTLAEEIALRAFPKGRVVDDFTKGMEEHDDKERSKLADDIEKHITEYACRATEVAGLEDPTKIAAMIWYRKDGWQHGGCAISWEERAEELEKDLKEARGLLEDVRKESVSPLCASYEYDPVPTAEERLRRVAQMTKDYE